jgi:XRE family aerobic/anaerobic benzoate catabolism transcriptional regulator
MSKDLLARLGGRVRLLRRRKELSLQGLASASGLSLRYVGEIEAGRANVSVTRLAALAAALGTRPSALLADDVAGSKVVALLGLRGAGKSALGARVAKALGVAFVELDRLIEAEAGLSLGEIFDLHGEETYRRLEFEVLRRFLDQSGEAVLATSGGIVAHEESFRLLEERTFTVWLKASPDDHWERVVAQGDARPMADNPGARAELRRILAAREPLYARARLHVDTSALGTDASVQRIVAAAGEPAPREAASGS